MNPTDYLKLRDQNEEDEKRFSDFSVNCAFALIAASWAIHIEGIEAYRTMTILSILLPVLFLFFRGLGHYLNIKHNCKIIDAESTNKKNYEHDSMDQTWQGQASNWLNKFEIFLLFLATFVFLSLCILLVI